MWGIALHSRKLRPLGTDFPCCGNMPCVLVQLVLRHLRNFFLPNTLDTIVLTGPGSHTWLCKNRRVMQRVHNWKILGHY